jgi:hypothetical protein
MPPRPRPRPANRPASGQNVASSSTTRTVSLAKTDRELELDKGDELFLRNRNMTAKDWKKLDKLAKGESGYLSIHIVLNNADACIVEQQVRQSSDGDSVEELSDASSGTPRKRRKARQRDDNDLPEWTRNVDIR